MVLFTECARNQNILYFLPDWLLVHLNPPSPTVQQPPAAAMVQESFQIVDSKYGKAGVKILHASTKGGVHTIRELEVGETLIIHFYLSWPVTLP